MPENYPPPSYAVYAWIAGDQLMIGLPPASGIDSRTHTAVLPLDRCQVETNDFGSPLPSQRGWAVLIELLKQRDRARRSPPIGAPGSSPKADIRAATESDTKYQAWLDAIREDRAAKAEEKREAENFLANLGVPGL